MHISPVNVSVQTMNPGLRVKMMANPKAGDQVIDVCAAPGGKTTDLAASLRKAFGDDFILVSNEVMKARAGVLADNVALWGDPNVVVTSDDPLAFAVEEAPGHELLTAVQHIGDAAVHANIVIPVDLVVKDPQTAGRDRSSFISF